MPHLGSFSHLCPGLCFLPRAITTGLLYLKDLYDFFFPPGDTTFNFFSLPPTPTSKSWGFGWGTEFSSAICISSCIFSSYIYKTPVFIFVFMYFSYLRVCVCFHLSSKHLQLAQLILDLILETLMFKHGSELLF